MKHKRKFTRNQIGRPIDFAAFDGKLYNGRLVNVKRNSCCIWVIIDYYIPGLSIMGPFRANLTYHQAKERVTVL